MTGPLEAAGRQEWSFGAEPDDEWVHGCISTHNRCRARHFAPPLEWSPKLAEWAREAADTVVAGGTAPDPRGYGQLVIEAGDEWQQWQSIRCVEYWYGSGAYYDFAQPEANAGVAKTEAFSQVCWSGTTHVGMARDTVGGGVIVAVYFPAGNVAGKFGLNVLPEKQVRRTPLEGYRTNVLDAEVRSVLESLDRDVSEQAKRHLLKGSLLEVTYLPPPHGSALVTFFDRDTREPHTVHQAIPL